MASRRRVHAASFALALVALAFASGATAKPASHLTRVYRANDGSYLYLRQVGGETGTVYGFGEHPTRNSAFVIKATVSSDLLQGAWWDVPKGRKHRVSKGEISLRWSLGGAHLQLVAGVGPGPLGWNAVAPTAVTWTGPKLGPEFQSTSGNDLTGAYDGDDGSRSYARETSANVVWVTEKGYQPGERPGWVSVFTGKRQPNGHVAGTWVDVPKGLESRAGSFDALQVPGTRKLLLGGGTRTKGMEPDYALDFNAFAEAIEKAMKARGVTGWAYAIGRRGALLRSKAGGLRLRAADGGPKSFTVTTQSQAGSTSKTLTAAALVKALAARRISLDTPIGRYLPSCWKRGPRVERYTFRQLLDHTSSLPRSVSCPKDNTGRSDPYECLRKAVEVGQDGIILSRTYNNLAYGLMRFLVPAVLDLKSTQATFELTSCRNIGGVLNRKISEKFTNYLFGSVVRPTGAEASYYPSADRIAFVYDKNKPQDKGISPLPDFALRGGAGYLAISALDMIRFLGGFERGEVVSPSLVAEMKRGNLGFDLPWSGATGSYQTKNGTCPGSGTGPGCGAQLMLYPGGLAAYVIINSGGGGNLAQLLRDAYDAALL